MKTELGIALPHPVITETSAPFWRAAAASQLTLQRCSDCNHLRYPVSARCPRCLSEETLWEPVSGRGVVHAIIVYRRSFSPELRDHLPYAVTIIQLEEGPRMISNLIGDGSEDAKVGDRVRVIFDEVSEDVSVPRFALEDEEQP